MYIPLPDNTLQCDAAMRENLQRFIDHPEPAVIAPCPGCAKHVSENCSPKCSDAPQALSIDPVKYPLEPKVIPLVYEVMASAGLKSCWSCEGHMDNEGELWKVPQVCFYSDTPIYPQLVLMHLLDLYQGKKLSFNWHIVLSEFNRSLDITYSIQPNLNQVNEPHLGALQHDMQVIAENMHRKVKAIAQALLDRFC